MLFSQRVAFALITFGLAGVAVIVWQSQSHATNSDVEPRPAYFLAISTGAGLRLDDSTEHLPSQSTLSCNRVFRFGSIEIGAQCVARKQTVSNSTQLN